jgi:hypothetical protein
MLILLELPTEEMDSLQDLRSDVLNQLLLQLIQLQLIQVQLTLLKLSNIKPRLSNTLLKLPHNTHTLLLQRSMPSPKRSVTPTIKFPSNMPDTLMSQ